MGSDSTSARAPSAGDERLRMPRDARMRRRADFARVYREGVRVRGSRILVVAAPTPHGAGPRLGLSVGRRLDRRATARNRVRRVLREAFRLRRRHLPALDLILIPHREARDWHAGRVAEELAELAGRAARKLAARAAAAEERP